MAFAWARNIATTQRGRVSTKSASSLALGRTGDDPEIAESPRRSPRRRIRSRPHRSWLSRTRSFRRWTSGTGPAAALPSNGPMQESEHDLHAAVLKALGRTGDDPEIADDKSHALCHALVVGAGCKFFHSFRIPEKASMPSKLWVAGSNPAGVAKSMKSNSFPCSVQYGCEVRRKLLLYGHSPKKIHKIK